MDTLLTTESPLPQESLSPPRPAWHRRWEPCLFEAQPGSDSLDTDRRRAEAALCGRGGWGRCRGDAETAGVWRLCARGRPGSRESAHARGARATWNSFCATRRRTSLAGLSPGGIWCDGVKCTLSVQREDPRVSVSWLRWPSGAPRPAPPLPGSAPHLPGPSRPRPLPRPSSPPRPSPAWLHPRPALAPPPAPAPPPPAPPRTCRARWELVPRSSLFSGWCFAAGPDLAPVSASPLGRRSFDWR